jgi:hypothetical protein
MFGAAEKKLPVVSQKQREKRRRTGRFGAGTAENNRLQSKRPNSPAPSPKQLKTPNCLRTCAPKAKGRRPFESSRRLQRLQIFDQVVTLVVCQQAADDTWFARSRRSLQGVAEVAVA